MTENKKYFEIVVVIVLLSCILIAIKIIYNFVNEIHYTESEKKSIIANKINGISGFLGYMQSQGIDELTCNPEGFDIDITDSDIEIIISEPNEPNNFLICDYDVIKSITCDIEYRDLSFDIGRSQLSVNYDPNTRILTSNQSKDETIIQLYLGYSFLNGSLIKVPEDFNEPITVECEESIKKNTDEEFRPISLELLKCIIIDYCQQNNLVIDPNHPDGELRFIEKPKQLISLEEYEENLPVYSLITSEPTGIACPKCGTELIKDCTCVKLTFPEQYDISCPECDYTNAISEYKLECRE